MSEKENQLQKILDDILEDKNANLTPDNLKKGVTVLGVTGNLSSGLDTGDATATADDILAPKTAYTASGKVTGKIITETTSVNDKTLTYTIPVTSADCNSYMFALTSDRQYLFEVSGSTIKVSKKNEQQDSNEYSVILTKTASDLGITIGGYTFSVGAWGLFGDNNKCLITLKNSSYNSNCYGLVFDKSINTISTSYKRDFGGYNAYGWAIAHPTIPDIVATNIGIYKYGTSSVKQIASTGNPSSYYMKQFCCEGTMFVRTSENKNQSN